MRQTNALRQVTNKMTSAVVRENVWDYPRPPRLEKTSRRLRVTWCDADGKQYPIADTTEGYRVLETSHPPTYYLPRTSLLDSSTITPSSARQTFCEWKGRATYHDYNPPTSASSPGANKPKVIAKIWSYESPTAGFKNIKGFMSFYAAAGAGRGGDGAGWKCFVDEEEVIPQDGDFYGGWKTTEIVGKMKGGPGTMGW